MGQTLAVVVFDRPFAQHHAVQAGGRGGYFALSCRSHQIHIELSVASMALEGGTDIVGLETVGGSKGVDHGGGEIVHIEYTSTPDATVATYSVQDEHVVFDACSIEYVNLDIRREVGFRVTICDARADGDICDLSALTSSPLQNKHILSPFLFGYKITIKLFCILSPNPNPTHE
jgi:hypothetical protein